LHPRNAHRGRYDFQQLIAASPELAAFVVLNEYADESVDFANPAAVKALNRALLKQVYGIQAWDIPSQYLCPPIPGRADYVHLLADLLATVNGGVVPRGEAVRVLDIGTGANCIYPLIGQRVYGWQFVGSDIDATALANAQRIVDANHLGVAINLRLQSAATSIFKGVLQAHEQFDLTLCNPPFHGSLAEAAAGSQRKWNNLRRESGKAPVLNFGGQGAELFCAGGEAGFVRRMIAESAQFRGNCLWFSTLVSKADNLPTVYRALKQAGVLQHKTMDMAQGQKKSRLVAWTFLDDKQQQAWRMARWA
jgi:23S rRNA (adenine1618-N6)-methyltransferase